MLGCMVERAPARGLLVGLFVVAPRDVALRWALLPSRAPRRQAPVVPGQQWDQLGLRVDTQKPGEALGCHGHPQASLGKPDSSACAAALGSEELYVPHLLCASL